MTVDIYGVELEVVEHPLENAIAHAEDGGGTCRLCALAVRPDTAELVIAWRVGRENWVVSRATPEFERHRDELLALGTRTERELE